MALSESIPLFERLTVTSLVGQQGDNEESNDASLAQAQAQRKCSGGGSIPIANHGPPDLKQLSGAHGPN